MKKITKLFSNQAIKSIDEKLRTATYIISTDEKDRMNEVVEQSWDLDNYKQNPIVLWGHDPSNPDNVLGKAIEIATEEEGERNVTTATVQFADEGTSRGVDTVWSLVKQGILRTVSVGFIPHTYKDGDADKGVDAVLADNELLEFSIVPIPANPQAVALAYGDESIEEKDAKWLIKQYKQEQTFLEKTLYDNMKSNATNIGKAKEMSDEDIQKVASAVGGAVAEALAPKLDEILAKVEGETPDEEEDDNVPPTEEDVKQNDEANSEQKDEDGAEDENEELDEEAQKAFLADLEKEYKEIEGEE